MDVERDVVERRIGGSCGGNLAAALQVRTEVEAGRDGNLGHHDVAGNGGGRARSHPAQFGIGSGADTRRVAEANVFAGGSEIEVELLIVESGIAFQIKGAPAGAGLEILDVDAVAGEYKRSVELAQAAGQPRIGDGTVGQLQPALGKRLGERAAHGHVHVHKARRVEIGIDRGKQFEIEVAIGGEIEFASARGVHGAVCGEIRSLAYHVQLLNLDSVTGQSESNWILVTQLDVFDVERNVCDIAGDVPLIGLKQRAAHLERTRDVRMSGELAAEVGTPQGVQVEVLHAER